ncbi:glycosyltransferase family 1 protein [Nocardioides ginkgobilobae]
MRVAIVTESFLPSVNGVAGTVRHVVDRLVATGHKVIVVAPGPGPTSYGQVQVVRVRSMALPGYRAFPLGLPDPQVHHAIEAFRPDVVHLASPILLGAVGLRVARRLDVPSVAVFQTDVAGFARQYGVRADRAIDRWVASLHRRADRTLVPSTASRQQLAALGVGDLHLWRRGVALDLFGSEHRDEQLRAAWTGGEQRTVVGYVGRLAPEKRVRRLVELADLPGTQLVVVGDGPERAWLQQRLPHAVFTGMLGGHELARAFASLDVFVHTGEDETFCQTVQEAQASGVAVVAPASGGPLDLVDHGRTGLLYDVRDPHALRRTTGQLVADPAGRARLGSLARGAVGGRTWASVVDDLVGHYRAVLDARGGVRAAAGAGQRAA